MPLNTQTRPWAELKPHPHNPRNGDTDAIVQSLRTNGQFKPIVTTPDGTILAGNHTYMAAGELGWATMECVVLDLDPYSPDAKRIMLADNRTSDLGRYDHGLLLELLQDLGDLDGTGYEPDDLDALRHLNEPLDLDDLHDEHGDVTTLDLLDRVPLLVDKEQAKQVRRLIGDDPEKHALAAATIINHL
jgi:ParB-like chromosome segregation protein Spo0J